MGLLRNDFEGIKFGECCLMRDLILQTYRQKSLALLMTGYRDLMDMFAEWAGSLTRLKHGFSY